jgi:uncharacterized protein
MDTLSLIESRARKRAVALLLGVLLSLATSALRAQPGPSGPSFDCRKAWTPIEHAICNDSTLAQWDAEMARLYRAASRAQGNSQALIADQRRWIMAREQCATRRNEMNSCILEATKKRAAGLAAMVPGEARSFAQVSPLETALANCDAIAAASPPRINLNPLIGSIFNPFQPHPQEPSPVEQERLRCRQQAEQQAREAEAQVRYRQAMAEQSKREQDLGYRRISFEDFKLDAKQLAAREEKVSVQGLYAKYGKTEMLFVSFLARRMAEETGRVDAGIALLTDDASRNLRKYFLECLATPAGMVAGCPVTVMGRVTTCASALVIDLTEVPCLDVQDGWIPGKPD